MKVTEIMQAFPEPKPVRDVPPGESHQHYCVGGALCQYTGKLSRWPTQTTLSHVLMEVNPSLSETVARRYANDIMVTNDTFQNIPLAWNILDSALKEK